MANKKRSLDFSINVDVITKTNKQIDDYVNKIREIKNTVGDRLAATFLDDTILKVKQAGKDLSSFSKIIANTKLGDKERFSAIEGAVASYKQLGSIMKSLDKDWMKQAIKNNDTMLEQLEEMIKRRKELSIVKGKVTKAENTATKATEVLTSLGYDGGATKDDSRAIERKIREAQKNKKVKEEQGIFNNQELDDEINKLNEIKKNIDIIIKQRDKLKDYGKEAAGLTAIDDKVGLTNVDAGARRLDTKIASLSKMTEDPKVIEDLTQQLQSLNNEFETNSVKADKMGEVLHSNLTQGKQDAIELQETTQTLKQVFAQFGIGISAVQIVNYFKNMALEAFNFYKSLDAALNEIYVVSNLSSDAVNNLKDNFIAMAEDTGMALDDVTRSAVLFYQQGLNTDEVLEMTEVTSEFAKVAGIDATDAADKLTAAVNGYCLEAADAALVADKFNKVAAASAADIDELSTAFSKAAAQANQAGVGMDNYLAYIATMVEATREAPENIGTSLKTIMSRMQQVKESGTTEDGETDVNAVETALKSVGVSLRDTNGELRDLEEVLGELGPKWNSLDRNTQAYLGTIIAGTRQQSRFITLMQNWDRVLELSEDSANSAGQQALMHAKAMESIESKVQQFQVAWQEFTSNLASSDFFKGVIELFTKFINVINSSNKPMVLLSTGVALLSKYLVKLDGPLNNMIKGFGSKATEAIKGFSKENLRLAKNFVKNQKHFKKYTAAINDNRKSIAKSNDIISKNSEQMEAMQKATNKTHEELAAMNPKYKALSDEVDNNRIALSMNQDALANNEAELAKLNPELDKEKEAYDNLQTGLTGAIVGLSALSAMLPGLAGDLSGAATGIMMMVKGITSIGPALLTKVIPAFSAFKNGVKTGLAEIGAAITATGIGAIIQAIVLVLTGAVTAVKALIGAFGNQDAKIAENVKKMGESLQNYSNALNKSKGAKTLIEEYEKLSNKIYLTATEQERLNTLAQELGDSLELETIEDRFGNLSISIEDAKDKLEALETEAAEARDELVKAEQESIEDFDHNGKVDDFYEKYLKKYRADIRNAMGDINTGIDTKQLATSASNVETIMRNLKNVVIDNSAEMSEAFGGVGIKWSLTEDVESMMKAFDNADIKPDQWNDLYGTFNLLQEQIDTLSYDKALQVVEDAVLSWGKAAGLTKEQLDLMTDSLMKTLYGGSALHDTMSKYKETIDKADGTAFTDGIKDYKQQLEDLKKESTTFGNPFKQDDAEREYESIQKKKRLLEEEQRAYKEIENLQQQIDAGYVIGYTLTGDQVNLEYYRNQLMEKYNIASSEAVENAREMYDLLKQMNDASAEWFSKGGLFDEDSKSLLNKMNKSGDFEKIIRAYQVDDTEGTKALANYLTNVINTTDDKELKKVAQAKLEKVFTSIEVSGTMNWKGLHTELTNTTEDLRKMTSIMEEFRETGGLSLDTFGDLCDVLDNIDLAQVFDLGAMDKYLAALDNLELGFDATTGAITMNAGAMQSLEDIQELAAQAKLKQTAQSLEADKASLQSQIYMIEAEIKANQSLIEWLTNQGDVEIELKTIKKQAEASYGKTLEQATLLTGKLYQDMTTASSTWATASITNAAKVGDAIKAAMTGNLGRANLSAYLKGIIKDMKWSSTGGAGTLEIMAEDGKVNATKAIEALKSYNAKGQNTINGLLAQMKGIEQMQILLTKMSNSDLSKLGIKGDKNEIEKYIGQLEEIYNTLRKIEGIQARINNLEDYRGFARGQLAADYLQEQVTITEELFDLNKKLLAQQKYMENTEQQAILGSPVGNVFSFDGFGNIIIDYKKYNALQDESIDGQQTLKELADELYDEYQNLHETTLDYYEDLISSLESSIDLQQELVDTYVDLEKNLADAVKDIYQEMLDNKLESIDLEIEALGKLQEAREKANQAKEDSKDLSDMQTSLKRAMMDTSGASNTKVLSYQDQIKSKLEQMGEDEYTQRLDSITEALEEQKEQLQREFDEFFEDYEALYDLIETRILPNEEAVYNTLMSTEEYLHASDAERAQLMDEWETQYKVAMTALQDGKSILDVVNSIMTLKDSVTGIDELLKSKSFAQEVGSTISQALTAFYNNRGQSRTGGGSTTGNYNDGGSDAFIGGNIGDYNPSIGNPASGDIEDPSANSCSHWTMSSVGKQITDGLSKSGAYIAVINKNGQKAKQNIWKADMGGVDLNGNRVNPGDYVYWSGQKGKYIKLDGLTYNKVAMNAGSIYDKLKRWIKGNDLALATPFAFKTGGMADFTGPAWLDGTKSAPEAVLNAAQTQAFLKLADHFDELEGAVGNNVVIENISFQVDSMSSPADGERAFDAFVNRFKEIGSQTGLSFNKTRL